MPEFRIDLEWEDFPSARTPELSATWARLAIFADGVPVTKVEDHRSRGVRDAIYVPLYPIAEWLVANWWFLWHEWRMDRPDARHNLLAAREGFALPDLSFLPSETQIQLAWRPRPATEFGRVSFLSEGSLALPKEAVHRELSRFVDAVALRLNESGIASTFVASEWQAILQVEQDPDQQKFCELAARLGHDPFDPDGPLTDLP